MPRHGHDLVFHDGILDTPILFDDMSTSHPFPVPIPFLRALVRKPLVAISTLAADTASISPPLHDSNFGLL